MAMPERKERVLEVSAHNATGRAPFSARHPKIAGFGKGAVASMLLFGLSCTRPMETFPRPNDGIVLGGKEDTQSATRQPEPQRGGQLPAPTPASSDRLVSPYPEPARNDLLLGLPSPVSPGQVPTGINLFTVTDADGRVIMEFGFGLQSNVPSMEPVPNPDPPPTTIGPTIRF